MPAPQTHDAVPSILKSKCQIDAPPTKEQLVNAQDLFPTTTNVWEARFLIMYDAYLGQTGNLFNCDLQIDSIRNWDAQHLELKHETRRSP